MATGTSTFLGLSPPTGALVSRNPKPRLLLSLSSVNLTQFSLPLDVIGSRILPVLCRLNWVSELEFHVSSRIGSIERAE